MPEEILVCEECCKILTKEDVSPKDHGYHVCRMKKYKEEHYCESYVVKYERTS